MLQEAEAFAERIRGNYEWMYSPVTAADLIYLPVIPAAAEGEGEPYSVLISQSVHNIKNIQDIQNIYNQQRTMLRVLNQLLNRINLYLDGKATYQDRAFISAILYRLGIHDQQKFLDVIRLTGAYGNYNPYEHLAKAVTYETKGQMQSKMAAAILVNLLRANWSNDTYHSARTWLVQGERMLKETVENTTERFLYYHQNPKGYAVVKESIEEFKKEREFIQTLCFEQKKHSVVNHLELFYVVANGSADAVSSTQKQRIPAVKKEQIRKITSQTAKKEQTNIRTEDRNLNIRGDENRSVEELQRAFKKQIQASLEEQVHTRVQKQVQSQVQSQMNVLTDKVYGQLERRLLDEKKRRGL